MDSDRIPQSDLLEASLRKNKKRIREILQFRVIIESEVAAMAAKRADERDLRILKKSIQDQKERISDAQGYFKKDMSFHMSLARAAKNEVFTEVLSVVYDILAESRSFSLLSEKRVKTSFEHHLKIIAALEKRDEDGARRLMKDHLDEIDHQIESEEH